MTQSNDLPTRVSRAGDNIIDLRLAASAMLQAIDKNSADIAELIVISRYNLEVSRRNSEAIAALQASQLIESFTSACKRSLYCLCWHRLSRSKT